MACRCPKPFEPPINPNPKQPAPRNLELFSGDHDVTGDSTAFVDKPFTLKWDSAQGEHNFVVALWRRVGQCDVEPREREDGSEYWEGSVTCFDDQLHGFIIGEWEFPNTGEAKIMLGENSTTGNSILGERKDECIFVGVLNKTGLYTRFYSEGFWIVDKEGDKPQKLPTLEEYGNERGITIEPMPTSCPSSDASATSDPSTTPSSTSVATSISPAGTSLVSAFFLGILILAWLRRAL